MVASTGYSHSSAFRPDGSRPNRPDTVRALNRLHDLLGSPGQVVPGEAGCVNVGESWSELDQLGTGGVANADGVI